MTPDHRSYFDEHLHQARNRNSRHHRKKKFNKIQPWLKLSIFGLLLIGMVGPIPASTTLSHEGSHATGAPNSQDPISTKKKLNSPVTISSHTLHVEVELPIAKKTESDFVTATTVNDVLWHVMSDDQVNQQWSNTVLAEAE